MIRLRVLLQRLRALFRRHAERDLDDELAFHLQMEIEDGLRRGLSPNEARVAALRRFGGVARTKEIYRETRSLPFLDTAVQDLRYALRMLRANPAFTAVAVLSLALGIGANTAVFTLINALVLKPLPVVKPHQLVNIEWMGPRRNMSGWTTRSFEFFHSHTELFDGVFARSVRHFNVAFGEQPTPVDGDFVSGDYFPVLGVPPLLGRVLTPADDRESGGPDGPVAVISYQFWQARFSGDRDVVGRTLVVNDTPLRVAGVLPPWFFGIEVGRSPNLYIPLYIEPMLMKDQSFLHHPFTWWLDIIARRKAGLSDAAFHAGLDAIAPRLFHDVLEGHRLSFPKLGAVYAGNGISDLRQQFTQPLLILMGISGIVLLIACANVANLLLARTSARRREISVRQALGASRPRLFRQLLTESVLLSGLGAAAGIAFAFWGCRALLSMLSSSTDAVTLNVRPDPWVLAFTAAVATLTGIVFGAGPAFRASAAGAAASLKEGSPTVTRRSYASSLLVVSQVALCLVLLIGAGLFMRTFWNLTNQHLGFDRRNVYVAEIDPRPAGFQGEALRQLYAGLYTRLNQQPAIESASLSELTPIADCCWSQAMDVEGSTVLSTRQLPILLNNVAPGFFQTFGTRLLAGRDFTLRDTRNAPPVAIVSESFARRFLPGQNPVGKHISLLRDKTHQNMSIVGVVEDTVAYHLRSQAIYQAYFPLLQSDRLGQVTVEIRTGRPFAAAAPLLRSEVQSFQKRIPVNVESFDEQIARDSLSESMTAILAGFFGSLALLLACIGLYGTMSYAVIRRTGELGLRMALGAQPSEVTGMILRHALLLAGAGAALGIPAALACARWLTSLSGLLYGLRPDDPPTIAATAALLIALAALAGYLPARRAARLDPVQALRNE
jgi:putative ABC transport system permease protein